MLAGSIPALLMAARIATAPSSGAEILDKVPKLYETETIPLKEKLIYLHFFIGGCDWYIAEYDGDNIFWGQGF